MSRIIETLPDTIIIKTSNCNSTVIMFPDSHSPLNNTLTGHVSSRDDDVIGYRRGLQPNQRRPISAPRSCAISWQTVIWSHYSYTTDESPSNTNF